VVVDGRPARASQIVAPGQVVTLRYANRFLEVRLLDLPGKSVSRKAARELYEIIRDESSGDG